MINSNARLTYGQAERREAPAEILEQLELERPSSRRALREARFARGALEVQSPEVAFAFDGRGGSTTPGARASRTRTCWSRS